jgi:ribosome maturation factor RimP
LIYGGSLDYICTQSESPQKWAFAHFFYGLGHSKGLSRGSRWNSQRDREGEKALGVCRRGGDRDGRRVMLIGRRSFSGTQVMKGEGTVSTESLLARLTDLACRAAEPLGLQVAWVEWKRRGGSGLFRVFIDREEGVGLQDCQAVSERLSVLLDVEDPIESSYTLEVSSPGLDRPLWDRKDFERFTGRLARITTREQLDGRRRFLGRLAGVEGDAVLLDQKGEQRSIPLPVIESARLEVEEFSHGLSHSNRKRL